MKALEEPEEEVVEKVEDSKTEEIEGNTAFQEICSKIFSYKNL